MQHTTPLDNTPHATIVYYGPGMAGKSTNLQSIARLWPAEARSELRSEGIETYRRVSLDLLVRSTQTRRTLSFTLVTTPGCILYDHSRTSSLKNAAGVVFVADSQKNKLEENLKHLRELALMLVQYRRDTRTIPIVMQYNKRDVPPALDFATLQHYLNAPSWPVIEAVATQNVGVIETLRSAWPWSAGRRNKLSAEILVAVVKKSSVRTLPLVAGKRCLGGQDPLPIHH